MCRSLWRLRIGEKAPRIDRQRRLSKGGNVRDRERRNSHIAELGPDILEETARPQLQSKAENTGMRRSKERSIQPQRRFDYKRDTETFETSAPGGGLIGSLSRLGAYLRLTSCAPVTQGHDMNMRGVPEVKSLDSCILDLQKVLGPFMRVRQLEI